MFRKYPQEMSNHIFWARSEVKKQLQRVEAKLRLLCHSRTAVQQLAGISTSKIQQVCLKESKTHRLRDLRWVAWILPVVAPAPSFCKESAPCWRQIEFVWRPWSLECTDRIAWVGWSRSLPLKALHIQTMAQIYILFAPPNMHRTFTANMNSRRSCQKLRIVTVEQQRIPQQGFGQLWCATLANSSTFFQTWSLIKACCFLMWYLLGMSTS